MTDAGEEDMNLPERVFVPAHPSVGQGTRDVALEIRRAPGGGSVLPVFTTVDRLVSTLGPYQPWVYMPLRAARAIVNVAGVHDVVLDPSGASTDSLWTRSDIEAVEGRDRS